MKHAFEKYINPKSPAKIKEEFRQEKRKVKAKLRADGEEFRKQKALKLRGENTTQISPSNSNNRFTKNKSNQTQSSTQPSKTSSQQAFQDNKEIKKTKNYGLKNERFVKNTPSSIEEMPLNKFIAHAGITSRREAANMVKQGLVKVNGDIIFEPAFKVSEKDTIIYNNKKLEPQQKLVYILMNKPKDHITTTKDDKGRKTVLNLLKNVDVNRIYPIGRLDRNTTGVLLLTNDGELAQKLTHPSFNIKKIYEVMLNKPLLKKDIESIAAGITLEDGLIKADAIDYVDAKDKSIIGIEIHSGRNRIVRRIFENLGYEVKKLDRVMFANLTKKNVERGKWRYLSEKEIRLLKYMNASMSKKNQKKEQQINETGNNI